MIERKLADGSVLDVFVIGKINHVLSAECLGFVVCRVLPLFRSAADDDGVSLGRSTVGAEPAVWLAGGDGVLNLGFGGQQVALEGRDGPRSVASCVEAGIESAANAGSASLVEVGVVGDAGVVAEVVLVRGQFGVPAEDGGVQEGSCGQGNSGSHIVGFDGISIC